MLRVAVIYPELFGTYGDGGNALVLLERARRRSIAAEVLEVSAGEAVPDAELYLLGGGEDGPQRFGAELLRDSSFAARVADGAHVVAVCAGLQVLGTTFAVEGNDEFEGLGLVEATTRRGDRRSVGDLVVRVGDEVLVGFENHGGRTTLGAGLQALGTVSRGRGNDGVLDGYRGERLWATYAHGPVMAQNPWFADAVLSAVLGRELEPIETMADRLYLARRDELR